MLFKKKLVPFRMTVCGIEELGRHGEAGVTHVLSILDPGWPEPEALAAFEGGQRLQLRFHDVIDPHPGAVIPESRDIEQLLTFARELKSARGTHLLVHCHAGVSRSTAAALLILAQARPDRPAEEALFEVVNLRPRAWPNLRILELGDELLGRRGEIVGVARTFYRRVLDREPWLADQMIDGGRGREVAEAANV